MATLHDEFNREGLVSVLDELKRLGFENKRQAGTGVQYYLMRQSVEDMAKRLNIEPAERRVEPSEKRERICEVYGGKLAGAVKALEEKADTESRDAGATEKPDEILFNYAWWMKKSGYSQKTIKIGL